MILNPINLTDPKIKKSLSITPLIHCNTWEFYYNQYTVATDYMLGIANLNNKKINRQFMSFMFILRHNVELMLKTNLDRNSISIKKTHKLSVHADNLHSYLASDFITNLSLLYCEDEGDCFKYIKGNNNCSFFNGEELKMLTTCNYLTELNKSNPNIFFIPFKNTINPDNKFLNSELTLEVLELSAPIMILQ